MDTNDRLLECKKELPGLQKELSKHEAAVDAIDVVGKRFKTLKAAAYLIDQLESRLSSSVEVALNKYVEEQKAWMRYENERLQRQLDQQLADQRYAEEVNRQIDHNWEMQRLAKKQLEETEKIRRDQEYYQRYGKSINEL